MDPMFPGDTSSPAIDPMFSAFTLQSLLTFNPSFFTDTFHIITDEPQLPNLPQSATDQTPYLNNKNKNALVVRKTEHPLNLPPLQEYLPLQQQAFNFFPQYCPPFEAFHHLPQLHSLEHSNTKRLRHLFTEETTPPQQKQPHFVRVKSPSLIPQSKLARQRRQTLSEKTRCLQKLMPWDKKMDQATLFEEAYKYVKFLQAQVSALQSMPFHSTTTTYSGGGGDDSVCGDLKGLNRKQALQVVVNSPVAQTKLYSQGYCAISSYDG
ncbi:hypothetical protein RYX36_010492 [Vicia faba]